MMPLKSNFYTPNNTFVEFGYVSYDKNFNEKQLLSILNKHFMSL